MLALMLGAAAEFGRYHVLLQHPGEGNAGWRSIHYYARIQWPKCGTNLADAKRMVVFGNAAGTGANILNGSGLTTGNVEICSVVGTVTTCPATGTPQAVTVRITGYTYTPIFAFGPMHRWASACNPARRCAT